MVRNMSAHLTAGSPSAIRAALTIGGRAKSLGPILHTGRIVSERDKKQLSLFANLTDEPELHVFATISDVRDVPLDSKDPVEPFSEEDDPITEFVRWTLINMKKSRGEMHALEIRSGISSGYCTKLVNDKERTRRVGLDMVRKFAPAMGYEDLGEFFLEAGKWWEQTGRAVALQYRTPETISDPELRKAVESAKGLATREVIEQVMTEFRDQIGKRDHWWWVQQMIDEAKAEFRRNADRVVDKKTAANARQKLKDARNAAPESARAIAGQAPPPAASSAKDLSRRRRSKP